VALCAQASSFFSCSFGTTSSIPIVPPPPPPAPSLAIAVTPATIVLGQSAVLSWTSTGVSACTASGAWSGPQSLQGSTKVTPASTGTFAYVLNCSTASTGSIAQSATLTVTAMAAVGSARHLVGRRDARVRRTDLVADVTGTRALGTDVNLSDPWGLVLPEKLPAVVASRRSNTSTVYAGAGSAQPVPAPPLLHLPDGPQSTAFGAAGIATNSGDDFIVSAAGKSAPAQLLYAGRAGMIAAWSPEVDIGAALAVFAADDSAAYTGLAIATSSTPGESHLYAADFRNGRIDVFDTAFRKQTPTRTKFAFTDPALPSGYAPSELQ
jgi:hypothetical protein